MNFNVKYKIKVNMALNVQDTNTLSQTPFSCMSGAIIHSAAIGNMSVPKRETSIDLAGRSNAVK